MRWKIEPTCRLKLHTPCNHCQLLKVANQKPAPYLLTNQKQVSSRFLCLILNCVSADTLVLPHMWPLYEQPGQMSPCEPSAPGSHVAVSHTMLMSWWWSSIILPLFSPIHDNHSMVTNILWMMVNLRLRRLWKYEIENIFFKIYCYMRTVYTFRAIYCPLPLTDSRAWPGPYLPVTVTCSTAQGVGHWALGHNTRWEHSPLSPTGHSSPGVSRMMTLTSMTDITACLFATNAKASE